MNDYLSLLSEKKMTLIMSLPRNDARLCEAAFRAGADVVKVHMNVHHHASGTLFGSLDEERPVFEAMLDARKGPMGVVPGAKLEDVLKDAPRAAALPFSFFSVYAHHIPASLTTGSTPLMAACDYSYSLEEAVQLEKNGASVLEASVVPGAEYASPLSMRDLLHYSALAHASSLPVVVPTQRKILPQDVPALLRAGVKGLMIGAVVTGHDEDGILRAIRAFKRAIEEATK